LQPKTPLLYDARVSYDYPLLACLTKKISRLKFMVCMHAGYAALLAACPMFEAFWQGRLIPGACVDTLPFMRSVRSKRTAAGKDQMPDEVFSRVR
jgi:hypothetical protein